MTDEEVLQKALMIVDKNKYAFLGTMGLEKYPNIRIMSKIKNEGLKKFYFSTRSTSLKVKQIKKNKRGCIYFYDQETYQTVMLEGIFKVEANTLLSIAEIYAIDEHDPFDYLTIVFETKTINFYISYETTNINI